MIASALDDWAGLRRGRRHDLAGARLLVAVASAADPEPGRTRLREALGEADRGARLAALWQLVQDVAIDALPATSLVLLGAGLAEAGDREAAGDLLSRAQLRRPGDVRLHHELARVLDALGQSEKAIEHYTAARAIRAEVAHELAHALARRGRTDEAIGVFRDLVERRPTNGMHAVCLAYLLKVQYRRQESVEVTRAAVAASRQAIKARPDDASAYQALGLALWAAGGKSEEALAAFRTTIRRMPGETAARIYVGRITYTSGRYDEAAEVLHEAVRQRPDDAEAWTLLGHVLTAMGRLDAAGDALSEAARLGTDSSDFHSALGWLFLRRGRWGKGADEFERARVNSSRSGDDQLGIAMPGHRSGVDHAGAWYISAVAQLRAGRIEQYRGLCRDMLQRFGDSFTGQAEMVARVCLMCPDDPDVVRAAALLAERVVKDPPPRTLYMLYTAGLADYRLGRYESTLKWVRASREANKTAPLITYRDPYRALTWLVEAMALARLGRAKDARDALAEAEATMAGKFPAEGSGGLYPQPWAEWAHCEIIHREARAVVEDAASPADPSVR
jgi:tetratricopeptide (TPR) repeat protein